MKKTITAGLLAITAITGSAYAGAPLIEEKIVFEARGDQSTEGFRGSLMVPENRANPDSRMIRLGYVRFPATGEKKGPPIIYLAGGPGGSATGTAKNYRFGMFMALRAYGDVIAFDQRGTGLSDGVPTCKSSQAEAASDYVSDADYVARHQQAFRDCISFWTAEGIDVRGYNTVENARDIEALREHLGAEKMVLWGTSYGSHLAFAAMKLFEGRIDRMILSSAEGLDQTIKQPARTDAYFDRLQQAVNSQPAAKAAYPDLKALMRRVHEKLEAKPVPMQLKMPDGAIVDFLFTRRDMQRLTSAMISDPWRANQMLALYLAMDHGVVAPFEGLLGRFFDPRQPITLEGMPELMDVASGMTAPKKAQIIAQAKSGLLGDMLNFTYHYDGVAPVLDLGDDFRTRPTSDLPVILFSGTLDGRTYPESQIEATAGLANLIHVTVENGGHNIFMASPKVQEAINRFMEDKPVGTDTITIGLPDLAPKI